jgi:nitrogen fixation protein NifU and related proteins
MSSLYSDQLLDHFQNPRHAALLPPPAVVVTVENPVCGDMMKLSARVDGAVVREAGFQVRGCTAAIAAGSALAEWLTGRPLAGLHGAPVRAILEAALGPLPPASGHVAVLCADALAALTRAVDTSSA